MAGREKERKKGSHAYSTVERRREKKYCETPCDDDDNCSPARVRLTAAAVVVLGKCARGYEVDRVKDFARVWGVEERE